MISNTLGEMEFIEVNKSSRPFEVYKYGLSSAEYSSLRSTRWTLRT